MSRDGLPDNNSNKNAEDNEPLIDKITEKTKEVFGSGDAEDKPENEEYTIDTPFQNTPDEGFGDVPTEDKIIRDPETGEETYIKNDNKR